MTKYTKWAEPVTYGSSKFEVTTDELHARPVAVVNTLDDARLIAAAPELFALAHKVAELNPVAGEIGDGMLAQLVDAACMAIAKTTGSES
ncbi:MAG: hypothetical protein ACYCZR_02195 [Burkholderiales bacterium]